MGCTSKVFLYIMCLTHLRGDRYSQVKFEEIWLHCQNSTHTRLAGSIFLCSFLWGGTTIEQEHHTLVASTAIQTSELGMYTIQAHVINAMPFPLTTWDSTGMFKIHPKTIKLQLDTTPYMEHTQGYTVRIYLQVWQSCRPKQKCFVSCNVFFNSIWEKCLYMQDF